MRELPDTDRVTLLDCTLRDGGYYTDWEFDDAVIDRYVRSMERARVPVVELGFRSLDRSKWSGVASYTTDAFVADVAPSRDIMLGVMMNAKEIANDDRPADAVIDQLFTTADDSGVDLVRLATTQKEIAALPRAVERLHELGYRVGVNMMRAHQLDGSELATFGSWCSDLDVDIAYFADSLGCMRPDDVRAAARGIAAEFDGTLGCHLHDNMSLAMANCAAAIEAGVRWVDGTILGMGRGPGNARTEWLALELRDLGLSSVDPNAMIGVVTGDFAELQREHGWGPNLYYYISALGHVHPTPVQQLLEDDRNTADEVIEAIEDLASTGGSDEFGVPERDAEPAELWDARGWCEGREVLLIGAGPSVQKNRGGLERLIRERQPLVIMLNLAPSIDATLIDVFVAANRARAIIDADQLPQAASQIIAPPEVIEHAGLTSREEVRAFQMEVQRDAGIEWVADGCRIARPFVAAYALALCGVGGASEVLTAGLDGYPLQDPRQHAMRDVLERFASTAGAPKVVSITPTSYGIEELSLYAPEWTHSQ